MLKTIDYRIRQIIDNELSRQENSINLISSENYTSSAVRAIESSILMSKYAEGTPKKRFYAGCEIVDEIESYAVAQAKSTFIPSEYQSEYHVNVQPLSGSIANIIALNAVLTPGDTIVSMDLYSGGHLSHGFNKHISGSIYTVVHYSVNPKSMLIELAQIESLVQKHRPKLLIVGASAYSRKIDFEPIAEITRKHGVILLADIAHIAGLVATELHPNPIPHADIVTLTTHKTLRGPRGAIIICRQELAARIDRSVMPGVQGGPFMHSVAAKAQAFKEAQTTDFLQYQQEVLKCAKKLAAELGNNGYSIVSGGTDTHHFVVNMMHSKLLISGAEAEQRLAQNNIIANRNTIPFERERPRVTSGLRIGVSAMVSRGCKLKDMKMMASLIMQALENPFNETLPQEVISFAQQFTERLGDI